MRNIHYTVITVLITCLSICSLQAQGFEREHKLLGIGVGIGNGNFPFGVHFESGIADQISVGGFAGYSSYSSQLSNIRYILASARGSYHFGNHFDGLDDVWDLYGGLSLYYLNTSSNTTSSNPFLGTEASRSSRGSMGLAIFLGARYFFSDQMGVFAELGTGLAWIQVGLAVKL
ncbi:MAG: hypothetical protein AAF696_31910 [Bacteroidota bacterium]